MPTSPTKLGVCSWSLKPTGPADLRSSIQQCGIHSTQLALDPFSTLGWNLDQLVQEFQSAQISICSGMMTTVGEDYSSMESIKATGGIRPDQHWEANQQRAIAAAETSSRLGLKLVTFHAGFIPEHGTTEYTTLTDRIKGIADIFENQGITLALETGQERAESLLEMLDLPNMSTIQINFDPANMILYGMGCPAQSLELLIDRIVQVHMKDAIATTTPGAWGTEVPAGQGEVDWDHFFGTIQTHPKTINVVIEREAGDQRIPDIIQARTLASRYGMTP
tara:strand:- start:641776 stop:642609 length:834 start_codon:yes stop_codon:yes gene_type:complete